MKSHHGFDKFRRNEDSLHPENDLISDADYANRYRPEPHSLEELSNAGDPVKQAAENRKSTKQAIAWGVGVPIVTIVVALVGAIVSRIIGGPLCDAGEAVWICSRAAEIWWPLLTTGVTVAGTIGSGIILWSKYKSYTRWRPWMGTFRATVSWSMLWMLTTFTMMIVGH